MGDDVLVLNQGYEFKTSKTGKVRTVVLVQSEPLVYSFDDKTIARGPAQAIADTMRRKIEDVSEEAAPATLAYRKRAAKALAEGKAWAVKRYAGGKTGLTPPAQTTQALHDSGRLAKSIVANWHEGDQVWRVNVAANRLDPTTSNWERVWLRLISLVPEFGNPGAWLEDFTVRRALEEATKKMRAKKAMTSRELTTEILEKVAEAEREVDETLSEEREVG
jgi:LPS sulfotransferase NodH